MSQDKTADLLSALKNAYAAGRRETCLPLSKFNFAIVKILIEEGYLDDVKKQKAKTGAGKEMVITLNKLRQMKDKRSCQIIKNIKRISKSSVRVYVSSRDLDEYNRRLGLAIISTPKGLMTTKQAKKKNFGGELICRVW